MRKLRDLLRRLLGKTSEHEHEHDCIEMPTAMGAKVLRYCRTRGCDYLETVDATPEQQQATAGQAARVRDFQRGIVKAVGEELRRKGL